MTVPPCGTNVLRPNASKPACMRSASTPQPDCTAMYCSPSTSNDVGTPVTPEGVGVSHSTLPLLASKARNMRSSAPPVNTSLPPVVSSGAQITVGNLCVHNCLPVFRSQACSS